MIKKGSGIIKEVDGHLLRKWMGSEKVRVGAIVLPNQSRLLYYLIKAGSGIIKEGRVDLLSNRGNKFCCFVFK